MYDAAEEHKKYLARLAEGNKKYFENYQDNLKRIEEENNFYRMKYEAQKEFPGLHNSYYDRIRWELRENAMMSLRSYALNLAKFRLP